MDFNRASSHGCPCRGCTDRQPGTGCHDRCERFQAWRKKLDERNKKERQFHQSNDTMSEDKKKHLWRSKRYSRMLTYSRSTKPD